MTNTTAPQLGRPVNPNSARQQRIKELNEKREQGLCKRGRPVVAESKRQEVLKARPELKEIKEYPLTPVVGAHAGPGTVGIGYILKK